MSGINARKAEVPLPSVRDGHGVTADSAHSATVGSATATFAVDAYDRPEIRLEGVNADGVAFTVRTSGVLKDLAEIENQHGDAAAKEVAEALVRTLVSVYGITL